jgi:hypothetical protein
MAQLIQQIRQFIAKPRFLYSLAIPSHPESVADIVRSKTLQRTPMGSTLKDGMAVNIDVTVVDALPKSFSEA